MTDPKNNDWLMHHHHNPGTYNGAEPRPFAGRPGAMDAYTLPSVVAGVRILRALPICAPTNKV